MLKWLVIGLITVVILLAFESCKKKEPCEPVETFLEMPQDIMDYFVNYEVGTCWVYEDLVSGKFDTIELVEKRIANDFFEIEPYNFQCPDTFEASKSYTLYFNPIWAKDFIVRVSNSKNNRFVSVDLDPNEAGCGFVAWGEENGQQFGTFIDTVYQNGKNYYEVYEGASATCFHSRVRVTKDVGIISLWTKRNPYTGATPGAYILRDKFVK